MRALHGPLGARPSKFLDFCRSAGWSASEPSPYSCGMISARDDVMVGLDPGSSPVEWRISEGLVAYEAALAVMEARAAAIADGSASELIWLIEHPPLYTAGTSAKADALIAARFPVHSAGRGGQFTYHGPGRAPLRGHAGRMDHPHLGEFRRRGRAARRPHRGVGAAAGQGRRLRGQDCGHRH